MKVFKNPFIFFFILIFLIGVNCKSKFSLKSFKVGSSSKYSIYLEMPGGQIATGKAETIISPWRKLGNQKVLPSKVIFNYAGQEAISFSFYSEDKDGIFLYAQQGLGDVEPKIIQGKMYAVKFPLKVGLSWEYSNDKGEKFQSLIVEEELVTVPAGDYNCFKIESKGKKDINGKIRNFKSYDWMDSRGGAIKGYIEFEEYDYLVSAKSFKTKMTTQLLSKSEK